MVDIASLMAARPMVLDSLAHVHEDGSDITSACHSDLTDVPKISGEGSIQENVRLKQQVNAMRFKFQRSPAQHSEQSLFFRGRRLSAPAKSISYPRSQLPSLLEHNVTLGTICDKSDLASSSLAGLNERRSER